jgi:primosomal protein N' (replication factor Y)
VTGHPPQGDPGPAPDPVPTPAATPVPEPVPEPVPGPVSAPAPAPVPPRPGPATEPGEQLALLRAATRRRGPKPVPIAQELPIARVVVDVRRAHLDRPFDYTVPATMADAAAPGVRVRVRFAGREVDGFVIERVAASEHDGRLVPLRRVVSGEQVLTAQVLRLARAVADRYAGTLPDVLRLAVPPRHAEVEKGLRSTGPRFGPGPGPGAAGPGTAGSGAAGPGTAGSGAAGPGTAGSGVAGPGTAGPGRSGVAGAWAEYPAGAAFLGRLAAGQAPRAVWTAPPGGAWSVAIAEAVAVTVAAGRGALIVVPDRRDVATLEPALVAALGPGRHVRLEADLGPADRYAAFLTVLRGQVPVTLGTRAAAFAPVAELGLVVIWDDGDELHAEPRAPYPHAREVLALRAEQSGAAMLLGSWSRTAEAAQLVASGWAREIEAGRSVLRRWWPRVVVAGSDRPQDAETGAATARIAPAAFRALREGLVRGSVLVQVPRAGYLPGLACGSCRRPARCPACRGPLRLVGPQSYGTPSCGWCGRGAPAWACPHCAGQRLRARAVGVDRTAEELGRAFPGARVAVCRAGQGPPEVPLRGGLVLATPGIEPAAPAPGYAAAVLLDADIPLERPDLRAAEEALRRWRAVAALVRPAAVGGLVVVCADAGAVAVQALVRGDPAGHAARELAERTELGLPPAVAAATITGTAAAVAAFQALLQLPEGVEVLGPVEVETGSGAAAGGRGKGRGVAGAGAVAAGATGVAGAVGAAGASGGAMGDEPTVRVVLRAPRVAAPCLAAVLRTGQAVRSLRRDPGTVRVRVDPRDLG